MKVRDPASRPVVAHRTYHMPDRRPLPDRRGGYEVTKVAPWRHKERRRVEGENRRRDRVYVPGRGSLHEKGEKEWR